MRRHSVDDATAERLLRGVPAERPELEQLTVLLSEVRGLAGQAPAPSPALAAMLRDGVAPRAAGAVPASVPVRSPLRRRLAAVAGLSLGIKVLAGTGVALASVTTAAGAGVLPAPVQDGVSSVVRTLTPFELEPRPVAPQERPAPTDPGTPRQGPAVVGPQAPAVPGETGPDQLPEPAPMDQAPGRGERPAEVPAAPPADPARPGGEPATRPGTAPADRSGDTQEPAGDRPGDAGREAPSKGGSAGSQRTSPAPEDDAAPAAGRR